MLSPKAYARVVQLSDSKFMVTGGSNLGVLSKETEIFDSSVGKFIRGPDLPKPIARHCAAKVEL